MSIKNFVNVAGQTMINYVYDGGAGTFTITTEEEGELKAVFLDNERNELPLRVSIDEEDVDTVVGKEIEHVQLFERRIRIGSDKWDIVIKVAGENVEPVNCGFVPA